MTIATFVVAVLLLLLAAAAVCFYAWPFWPTLVGLIAGELITLCVGN